MKKVVSVLAIVLAFTLSSNAQKKKTLDQEAIKDMCGCFEVTFNFTETFNYSNDSLYRPSETKVDKGLEYAFAIEDEDDKISIQHLLQVGRPDSPHIVKHWRQDWLFQNQDFYMYNGDNNWTFEKKSKDAVKGQWTQKVFQVDDSPRYEGSGTWVHVDGKNYWENTTTAPLPRREYTKRSDYNITLRGNRHEITNYGWVHDQDNDKVLRETGKEDVIIAKEKGFNTYKKVDDSRCQASIDWWKAQQGKWALVRTKWDAVYGRNKDLTLAEKVDNKVLFKYLLDDEITAKKDINSIIESFVK
ncbi:hypothetical protein DFQ09_10878 [Winogradskyella pacifica]|uniref:DKNYY family protein n=1 Tax=Winogradskyella pacifica TaxID=664642 RepID=A0A3D9LM02_9FLAO|nr:DUF6607 family protein [Winogradskyella pacifica]REE08202.1 hypothetical protein DFQ09_10878 [Winogradskyella pacifica]